MSSPGESAEQGALHAALVAELGLGNLARDAIAPLPRGSVSHIHYRVEGRGLILRVPAFSQWGLAPAARLAHEAAAFARAAPSGHTPRLIATLARTEALPCGALVVDEIVGAAPRLPAALGAIADALAALHALAAPPAHARAPLPVHRDPVSPTLEAIHRQARHIPQLSPAPEVAAALGEEIAWAERFAGEGAKLLPALAPVLVGTDTHPGNFLIDREGKAWFVDLEKALYGNPAIDLAHASLATSYGWDRAVTGRIGARDRSAFHARYLRHLTPARRAALIPWIAPMRRLTWLRTMTWFAAFHAEITAGRAAALSDASSLRHAKRHIARCFARGAVAAARAELGGFAGPM